MFLHLLLGFILHTVDSNFYLFVYSPTTEKEETPTTTEEPKEETNGHSNGDSNGKSAEDKPKEDDTNGKSEEKPEDDSNGKSEEDKSEDKEATKRKAEDEATTEPIPVSAEKIAKLKGDEAVTEEKKADEPPAEPANEAEATA